LQRKILFYLLSVFIFGFLLFIKTVECFLSTVILKSSLFLPGTLNSNSKFSFVSEIFTGGRIKAVALIDAYREEISFNRLSKNYQTFNEGWLNLRMS